MGMVGLALEVGAINLYRFPQPSRLMMGDGLLPCDIERQGLGNGGGHAKYVEMSWQTAIVACSLTFFAQ